MSIHITSQHFDWASNSFSFANNYPSSIPINISLTFFDKEFHVCVVKDYITTFNGT